MLFRIKEHPVLEIPEVRKFNIFYNGEPLEAYEGETVAATLLAHGVKAFRRTERFHEPRGIFCGIGQCTDCIMEVDGKPNVRTCVTLVHPGMVVRTQEGCSGENEAKHDNL